METTYRHLIYFLKRSFCNHPIFHNLYCRTVLVSEALFLKPPEEFRSETLQFANCDGSPIVKLRFALPSAIRAFSCKAVRFSIVDYGEGTVKSWYTPLPPTERKMALFKKYIPNYRPAYLKLRVPFMAFSLPHCCSVSKRGFICASNGFYYYVIDTKNNQLTVMPPHYLGSEPMCYSKHGGVSSDGRYWYFVRWPLTDWADMIDGKRQSVRCSIGRSALEEKSEEVLLNLEYQEDTHEIACSPDDRHLIFCTFRQDLNVPYPKKSYFSESDGYRLSHESGISVQKLVTVDLRSLRIWFTEIPALGIGHFVFDLREPDVFYLSVHNMVYHHMCVFLEGPASILKLRIKAGQTVVEQKFSDDGLLRIFQHEVFQYQGEQYLAVMSFSNTLYVLRASDLSLSRIINIGPTNKIDFTRTGNALCERRLDVGYTVNASQDGRFLAVGLPSKFVIYDMKENRIVPSDNDLPEFLVIGTGLPHTRTCSD